MGNKLQYVLKSRCVDKETLYYPVLSLPAVVDSSKYSEMLGHIGRITFRTDTQEVLFVSSAKTPFYTHQEIFEWFEKCMDRSGLKYELFDINSCGVGYNQAYINYLLPEYTFDIGEDSFTPFLSVVSAYAFAGKTFVLGLYHNGTESAALIHQLHRLPSQKRDQVGSIPVVKIDFGRSLQRIGEARRRLNESLTTPALDLDITEALKLVVIHPSYRQQFLCSNILPYFNVKLGVTYFALYVALSYYATHVAGIRCSGTNKYEFSRNVQFNVGQAFL